MTLQQLTQIFSSTTRPMTDSHRRILAQYVEPLNRLMAEYQINTPLRQSHFLAQLAHESGEFRTTEENLKYSATRLREVFPKYFKTTAEATNAAYNPERIANTVYANRYGNGSPESGDGYRFRGRGLIQTTFKANYQAFLTHLLSIPKAKLDQATDAAIHAPFDPLGNLAPLLAKPELAVRSACYYWQSHKLNQIADQGATDAVVTQITRIINGGTNGLSQRKVYFYRAQLALKNN